ncbi:MAG: tetratricopeptide repeat protein [Candidatus Omnitrophota bacterium]
MKGNIFFKTILPLIIAFVFAGIFFLSYNHYLLDKSLANLRLSLKDVENAKTTQDIQKVKNILDDTFLSEITKDDFDFASVLKIEASSQISKEITEGGQIQDLKNVLQEVVDVKTEEKSFLVSKVNEFLVNIFPQKREENQKLIQDKIKKIKEDPFRFKGKALQKQYLKLVKNYLKMKDWQSSLDYIGKIEKINSKNMIAYRAKFYKGIVYKFQGKFKQASSIFNKLKKDLTGKWDTFVSYQEADSLYQSGQKEKAMQIFENISRTEPYSKIGKVAQFRKKYIYSYDRDLRDMEKAKEVQEQLKEAKAIELEEIKVGGETGEKVEETVTETFDLDLETEDKGQSYLKEGFKFLREAYFAQNKEKITEWSALALDKFEASQVKKSYQAYLHIGKALGFNFLGNNQQAQQEIKKALEASSANPIVLQYAAYIYHRMGLIDESINAYQRVLLKNPEFYLIRYNLATLYLIKGDLSKARSNLIRVIENRPSYAPAYNNLAFVLWDQNEYGEATKNLKIATSLDPDYVDAHYNLGIIYYNLGAYRKAVEEFEKVKELKGDYRQVFKFLYQAKKILRSK